MNTATAAMKQSNVELMERIRAREGEEREQLINEMIERNQRLVTVKVKSYVGLNPDREYLFDDLVAEGKVALVESVQNLAERETPENNYPAAFIGKAIVWAITRYGQRDYKHEVGILSDDVRNRCLREQIQFTPRGEFEDGDDIGDVGDIEVDAYGKGRKRPSQQRPYKPAETLELFCTNEVEHQIVELRLQGYNDSGIGERLDVPVSGARVNAIRREMEERYNRHQARLERL